MIRLAYISMCQWRVAVYRNSMKAIAISETVHADKGLEA